MADAATASNRLPAGVQSQGVLFAAEASTGRVAWVSANTAGLLGRRPGELAGTRLDELFGVGLTDRLVGQASPEPCSLPPLALVANDRELPLSGLVHRVEDWLVLECEPLGEADGSGAWPGDPAVWVRRLQAARSIEEAAGVAADELRRLTGFDRVTVRRYDASFNAAIIAESRLGTLADSFVGRHFAAADTPAGARELLLANAVRLVADVDDEGAPLVGPEPLDSRLDLSRAALRVVSARHRVFLRGSGGRAALLLPIIVNDELWGLVACYHRGPRWVPLSVRGRAAERAQVLSIRLAALEQARQRARRARLQTERRRVWGQLEEGPPDLFVALSELGSALMAVLDVEGLAIGLDGRLARQGQAPEAAAIHRLSAWLTRSFEGDLFHTDSVGRDIPEVAELFEESAGVVALRLSEHADDWLLGFRPALFGPSAEPAPLPASSKELEAPSSRDSFEAWRHDMRLRSRPWESPELESAAAMTRLRSLGESRARALRRQHAQKMDALAELASGVAHNFNNVITALLGLSSLAARSMPQEHQSRDYLARIQSTLGHAAHLVEQLLAFTRKQIVRPRVLDLNDQLAGAQSRLRQLLPESIELDVRPGANLGLVRADPGQLDQVLDRLVANARDAMPTGGRLVVATGNAELTGDYLGVEGHLEAGPYVTLSVRDTGPGIPETIQARVFEPFFTTKEVGLGVGLGLATCFGIVRQSGGLIEVHSRPNRGATFTVYLPRVSFGDGPAQEPVVASQPEASERRPVVLVVDNESLVRFVAVETLQETGCEVLVADSAEAALQVMEEREGGRLDLLVSEVVMARIGGVALAELLRGRYPDLCVLFTTGYGAEVVPATLDGDGRTDVLEKPFMPDDLEHRVRLLLGGRGVLGEV